MAKPQADPTHTDARQLCCKGSFVGPLVGPLAGPLVGPLAGPHVGPCVFDGTGERAIPVRSQAGAAASAPPAGDGARAPCGARRIGLSPAAGG